MAVCMLANPVCRVVNQKVLDYPKMANPEVQQPYGALSNFSSCAACNTWLLALP